MLAADVMTTAVLTVQPTMTVRETAQLFVTNRISGAPVVDAQGRVVGMISEGDLLHREELETHESARSWWLNFFAASSRDAADYVKSHARTVEDVMTQDVISVNETATLSEIADLLETHRIKRVPVLRGGMLVGIVSRANLIQALASAPEDDAPAQAASDAEIRARLLGEIAGRKWSYVGRNLMVRDGVVHLWGSFWSSEEIHAARVAAENIPGVRRVEEHIDREVLTGI
jgi:CBS domain-containing protein